MYSSSFSSSVIIMSLLRSPDFDFDFDEDEEREQRKRKRKREFRSRVRRVHHKKHISIHKKQQHKRTVVDHPSSCNTDSFDLAIFFFSSRYESLSLPVYSSLLYTLSVYSSLCSHRRTEWVEACICWYTSSQYILKGRREDDRLKSRDFAAENEEREYFTSRVSRSITALHACNLFLGWVLCGMGNGLGANHTHTHARAHQEK